MKRSCIGFGASHDVCENEADPRSPYLCQECERAKWEQIADKVKMMTAPEEKNGNNVESQPS